jgi:hypothetical protein
MKRKKLELTELHQQIRRLQIICSLGEKTHQFQPRTCERASSSCYLCGCVNHALQSFPAYGSASALLVLCFPQCISSIMVANDLMNIEDVVTYVVKDRTGQVGERTSSTSPTTFFGNICAPKAVHRQAMDTSLREWKGKIDEAALEIKNTGLLPEKFITNGVYDSILALDHTVTTAQSRATASPPPSPARRSKTLPADALCRRDTSMRWADPREARMPEGGAGYARFQPHGGTEVHADLYQLYTQPKYSMLCYSEEAMASMRGMSMMTTDETSSGEKQVTMTQ